MLGTMSIAICHMSYFVILGLECRVEKLLIRVFYRSHNNPLASDEELYSLFAVSLIAKKFTLKIVISPAFIGIQYQVLEVPALRVISLWILCDKFS